MRQIKNCLLFKQGNGYALRISKALIDNGDLKPNRRYDGFIEESASDRPEIAHTSENKRGEEE